jgi:hypothetical protein
MELYPVALYSSEIRGLDRFHRATRRPSTG